jgi:hypothetical protein
MWHYFVDFFFCRLGIKNKCILTERCEWQSRQPQSVSRLISRAPLWKSFSQQAFYANADKHPTDAAAAIAATLSRISRRRFLPSHLGAARILFTHLPDSNYNPQRRHHHQAANNAPERATMSSRLGSISLLHLTACERARRFMNYSPYYCIVP